MNYYIRRQNNKHLESSGKYYAKIRYNDTITQQRIADELSDLSGVSRGAVVTILTDLALLLNRHLRNGDIVDLDDIGRFKLKVLSEALDTPSDFDPQRHIKSHKCLFCPATNGHGQKQINTIPQDFH